MLGRFGWFVAILMLVSGFFVARVPDATRPEYAGASAFFVVAFAIPSFWCLRSWLDTARAVQILAPLSLFAIGIEALAIKTGFPYGYFEYSDKIGAKVGGLVPWTVPFAWTPLVLGAYAFTLRAVVPFLKKFGGSKIGNVSVILAATMVLTVVDLVLDPGAVLQKFWRYQSPGVYYGVPLSNYFGWLLSGAIGMSWLHLSVQKAGVARDANGLNLAPAALMTSLWWILCFWSSVCAWADLWWPAAIGAVLVIALLRAARENGLSENR